MRSYFDAARLGVANKTVLVTGATSGIGLEVASALLRGGAVVILMTRSEKTGNRVKKLLHNPNAHLLHCDLADTDSIKAAVDSLKVKFKQIDILINNAGVMEPDYSLTAQGFETQFGVNYIGHYALTMLLLQHFTDIERIVTVSSLAAQQGSLNYETFKDHINYAKSDAYRQSKLANLIFSLELNQRFKAIGSKTISTAAHPGYAKTKLQRHVKGLIRKAHVLYTQQLNAQSPASGAMPILFAATDENATGTEYYVPGGPSQLSGKPIKATHPAIEIASSARTKLMRYTALQTDLKWEH